MIPDLDAALKPQSKNGQKACLIHALIPEFLGFNAASQYKGLRYGGNVLKMTIYCNKVFCFYVRWSGVIPLTGVSPLIRNSSKNI